MGSHNFSDLEEKQPETLQRAVGSPIILWTSARIVNTEGILLEIKLQTEQLQFKNLNSGETTQEITKNQHIQQSQSKGHSGVSIKPDEPWMSGRIKCVTYLLRY
jgi:hypothetical protein